jgi:hypothetical protein
MAVSYVLTKPNGEKVQSKTRYVETASSAENAFEGWREELARANGILSIKLDLGSGAGMEIQGTLIDGKREGVVRIDSMAKGLGRTSLVGTYLHDQKHGRTISYIDGQIWYEGEWSEDKKTGTWVINARLFKPAMILSFKNDVYHGEARISDLRGATIVSGLYENGAPTSGTFITNPWDFLEATKRREKSFDTKLLRFKDGQLLESSPIKIETGI